MSTLPRRQAGRPIGRQRALNLEALEDRRLLDAGSMASLAAAAEDAPWHNPVYRLDVNKDNQTTPTDALNLINRINSGGLGDLPPPASNPPQFYYDTSADNRLTLVDLARVINGILAPPTVLVSSLTPYTIDVTPIVMVTAAGTPGIADGTAVILDVDLNNDGDFGDAGEMGHTQSTMYAGKSDIAITPALARTSELYTVGLRARVKNADAVPGTSPVLPLVVDTQTSDALANYVAAPDASYTYSLNSSTPGSGYTYHVIDMTSQTWRSTADVNIPVWRHWVQVYVPTATIKNTAMLLIDGGNNTSGPPSAESSLGAIAAGLQSVFVVLKTIPNEPVIFTDETRTRSEDAIIAYTFDKFMTHLGEPGNETWPLLLPMVKSAVRAMDTIQDFIPDVKPGAAINDFLVTGYSKRGWTTWLTAAVDDRVRAIIPGVFDNLNQGPQMVHHYGVYGFFSEAVDDYEEMQIFERLLTPESQQLSPITDPYRYLNNGRFDDMPKLIMVSSGDEFFVTDSAQFYIHDLPGNKNYIRYIPNTGHGLELGTVVESTVTFTDALLNNRTLPTYSWTVAQDGSIHVQTPSAVNEVKLWQATNPNARDFRRLATPGINWTATTLVDQGGGNFVGDVPLPAQGATGYFVELSFPNPMLGFPDFRFTTEVRVKSTLSWNPWPFATGGDAGLVVPSAADIVLGAQEIGPAWMLAAPLVADDPSRTAAAIGPVAIDDPTRSAAAIGLAIQSDEVILPDEIAAPATILAAEQPTSPAGDPAPVGMMLSDAPVDEAGDVEIDAQAVDALFGSALDELLD